MGVVMGIALTFFGALWICVAAFIGEQMPWPIGFIFPLFGVVFLAATISITIYSFRNAFAKNRLSSVDITTDREEPDPLNQVFGDKKSGVEERLKEIDQLRAKGIISPAEHATQRERILREI